MRPSCYVCPYKSLEHPSDFTLADCWGIGRNMPAFNDNRGVSLLLINSEKAEKIFELINVCVDYIEIDIEKYMQRPLREPCRVNPIKRKAFWNDVSQRSFAYIVNKYGANSREEQIKRLANMFLPSSLKFWLKKKLGR